VVSQSLISLNDFLAGYAIDQAIPGPLFSFASFVSARSFARTNLSFLAGLVGGLSIFLPGTLLVFFIFPLWKKSRLIPQVKYFLIGVSVTAASLLVITGINQSIALSGNILNYVVVLGSALLLFSKKIPAPFIIVLAAVIGFLV
jgi:chromate transporter